jgi:hypothetical protein
MVSSIDNAAQGTDCTNGKVEMRQFNGAKGQKTRNT